MDIKLLDDGRIELGDFNALQAYKIARKLEKDGIAFYQKLLSHLPNETVNSAVKYLLETEKEHLDFFEKKISEEEDTQEDGFEEEDIMDYMDTGVFVESDTSENSENIFLQTTSALHFGLTIEKRSIEFYKALLAHTTDARGKEALRDIIYEEQRHADTLKQFI